MSKSTAQLREDLAKAVVDFRAADTDTSFERTSIAMADAAEALLTALDTQPSRQGKPYRLTFQHTHGPIRGKINRDSYRTLADAVVNMRVSAGYGARVALELRGDDGVYSEIRPEELAEAGYPDFTGAGPFVGQYGNMHYSLGS